MATPNRSLTDVFQNIVGNVQEIVRSEVRLAKTELKEEAVKAKSAAIFLGVGGISAVFAALFVLITVVYALALVMPNWAASLIVAVIMSAIAGCMLIAGIKRLQQIHPIPERTVETVKESVEWAKQQTK